MTRGQEIWKDITGYDGYYQASSLGRVRSLDRWVSYSNGRKSFYRGVIIEGGLNNGYVQIRLSRDGIPKTYTASRLVAMAFLDHKPDGHAFVVDHINGNRADNRVENLQVVTGRENRSTCFRSNEDSFSSKYVGVYWNVEMCKWHAVIYHDGNRSRLGFFDVELEASMAYRSALSKIKDGSFNAADYMPNPINNYRGVTFMKASNRWVAQIAIRGKSKYLGCYHTELEASNAYQSALSKIKDGSFNPDDYKPKFTSKYKGVGFQKASNKWIAQITINGKSKHIGLFKTELEAHHAYQSKLEELQIT